MTTRTTTTRTIAFAAPIGLSAFLLFTVEPLVGRLALPIFGGTPAVWATTLFFFQAVLLAGYLYAHVSVSWFGRWGPPIHIVLCALGVGALLIAPARVASIGVDGLPPALGVVVLLGRGHRPPGLHPHDDHAAAVELVRRRPTRRRRRPVLAVRPEQRRVVAGPARLSAHHRTAARAHEPARHLADRVRGPRRAADGRGGPSHARDRPSSGGCRRPRRRRGPVRRTGRSASTPPGGFAGSCWPPSRPACSRR